MRGRFITDSIRCYHFGLSQFRTTTCCSSLEPKLPTTANNTLTHSHTHTHTHTHRKRRRINQMETFFYSSLSASLSKWRERTLRQFVWWRTVETLSLVSSINSLANCLDPTSTLKCFTLINERKWNCCPGPVESAEEIYKKKKKKKRKKKSNWLRLERCDLAAFGRQPQKKQNGGTERERKRERERSRDTWHQTNWGGKHRRVTLTFSCFTCFIHGPILSSTSSSNILGPWPSWKSVPEFHVSEMPVRQTEMTIVETEFTMMEVKWITVQSVWTSRMRAWPLFLSIFLYIYIYILLVSWGLTSIINSIAINFEIESHRPFGIFQTWKDEFWTVYEKDQINVGGGEGGVKGGWFK